MVKRGCKQRLAGAAHELAESIPSTAKGAVGQAAHALQSAVPEHADERLVHALQGLWDALPAAARDRIGQTTLDVAAKIPATAEWAESQKGAKRRGRGWLALGLVAGAATGAGAGLLLSQSADGVPASAPAGPRAMPLRAGEQVRFGVTRARDAFQQGRTTVVTRARAEIAGGTVTRPSGPTDDLGAVDAGPAPGLPAVVRAPTSSGIVTSVKSRWRAAMAEAKTEAAEREAALRHKYLEDAKRI